MLDLKTRVTKGAVATIFIVALVTLQQEPIKIGYQLPLAGDTARSGEELKAAATIALERFNASGKIPVPVAIVFEYAYSDDQEGAAIARKFVEDRLITGVLGDFSSSASKHSVRIYERAGMPQLTQSFVPFDFCKGAEPDRCAGKRFGAVNVMLDAIVRSYPNVTRRKVRDALAGNRDGIPGNKDVPSNVGAADH